MTLNASGRRVRLAPPLSRAGWVIGAILTTVAACAGDPPPPAGPATPPLSATVAETADRDLTYYGASVRVGRGAARAYVMLRDGEPQELGIELTRNALDTLPAAAHDAHGGGHHAAGLSFELPMPREALAVTPFRTVDVGWVPDGHAAPYDRPHLDFHFYTIDAAQRDSIDPARAGWVERARQFPGAAYVPPGYVAIPALFGAPAETQAVPRMGVHWLDVASPELRGAPFTRTLFLGSWGGRMVFVEPMITLAHLRGDAEETVAIPQAAAYAPAGRHPSAYRMYWSEAGAKRRVALSAFVAR